MKEEGKGLTQLGSGTKYGYDGPCSKMLEVFDNQYPNRDYQVEFIFPEWTSLCPKTGQPDFATIRVIYTPDKKCIETKSLKLYFFAFRNEGAFMETLTNKILEDLVSACQPRKMTVFGQFNARGGTSINIKASYEKP